MLGLKKIAAEDVRDESREKHELGAWFLLGGPDSALSKGCGT